MITARYNKTTFRLPFITKDAYCIDMEMKGFPSVLRHELKEALDWLLDSDREIIMPIVALSLPDWIGHYCQLADSPNFNTLMTLKDYYYKEFVATVKQWKSDTRELNKRHADELYRYSQHKLTIPESVIHRHQTELVQHEGLKFEEMSHLEEKQGKLYKEAISSLFTNGSEELISKFNLSVEPNALDHAYQRIVEMGFTRKEALEALEASANPENALDFLLSPKLQENDRPIALSDFMAKTRYACWIGSHRLVIEWYKPIQSILLAKTLYSQSLVARVIRIEEREVFLKESSQLPELLFSPTRRVIEEESEVIPVTFHSNMPFHVALHWNGEMDWSKLYKLAILYSITTVIIAMPSESEFLKMQKSCLTSLRIAILK